MTAPPFLTHDLLAAPSIAHGFFTRHGGVSSGTYASLNGGLGSDDLRRNIIANRAAAAGALGLGAEAIRGLYQIHSPRAVICTGDGDADAPYEKADALVTATPGLALTILTADCAPCLLADPEGGVIAAAHAGWRGAVGGIIPATLAAMQSLGAETAHIRAVIGPAIARDSYQVAGDMRDAVLAASRNGDSPLHETEAAGFFIADTSTPARFLFDLAGYILAVFRACGLAAGHIAALDCDTLTDPRFFSHRGGDGGRLLNMIAIKK